MAADTWRSSPAATSTRACSMRCSGSGSLNDVMRSVIAYTSARILIFAVTTGLLALITPMKKEPLVLLAVSVLISGIISYVLLSRQRDVMSASVVASVRHGRRKFDAARTKEDAARTKEDA